MAIIKSLQKDKGYTDTNNYMFVLLLKKRVTMGMGEVKRGRSGRDQKEMAN